MDHKRLDLKRFPIGRPKTRGPEFVDELVRHLKAVRAQNAGGK